MPVPSHSTSLKQNYFFPKTVAPSIVAACSLTYSLTCTPSLWGFIQLRYIENHALPYL